MKNLDWLDFSALLTSLHACRDARDWVNRHQYGLKDALQNCVRVDWFSWLVWHHWKQLGLTEQQADAVIAIWDHYLDQWQDAFNLNTLDALNKATVEKMRAFLLPLIKES